MGKMARRRWGLVACVLLAAALVLALVPQGAWAEVAAEATDAAGQADTTRDGATSQGGASNQGGDSKDENETGKADKADDEDKDQGSSKDSQGSDKDGQQGEDAGNQEQESPVPAKRSLAMAPMAVNATGGSDASSHVHCTITSSATTFSSGDTGEFKVSYSIDPNSLKEGDTLTVRLPQSIASSAKLYVSSQHFKSKQDNGDGTWTLTFGPDAATALTGTFEMFVTMASVTSETTGDISVGNDSLTVKVLPAASQDSQKGTGTLDYVIRKDIISGDDVHSTGENGYYYFDNGHGVQAYKRDMSEAASTQFRLLVNEKEITMSGVTVTDTLPDGMTFDTSDGHGIKVYRVKDRQSSDVDESLYHIAINGNTLTFTYDGELSDTLEVYYWAKTPAGSNGTQFVNRADINYVTNGTSYADHRLCSLEGINYSAANGTKMVDKTELYSDDDQQVTYTFKFWNNNGFKKGEISLKDFLNQYVDFKTALNNDKFSVTWDADNHCVDITNAVDISADDVEYVSFVTDFSRVPGNTQVDNRVAAKDSAKGTYTIYGNTVHTYRYKARRVPLKTSVTVAKAWDDGNDQDGIRPQSVQVQLYANGKASGDSVTLSADNNWSYTWSGLDQTSGDDDITYTVGEVAVPGGYTSQVTGSAADGFTITNKHTPEVTTVKATKVWDDGDNQDGLRKDVTLHLMKSVDGGEATVVAGQDKVIKADATGDGLTVAWDNLPTHEGGKQVAYSVSEDAVEGYASKVTGDAANGFVVTNTHTPETTSVSGTKTWDDSDDQDGVRPDSITVRLLADGTEVASQTVKAGEDGTWSYSFTNLPAYQVGKKVTYTVTEDQVAGYTTTQRGNDLTNTHTPEVTSVKATKVWKDSDNQDGKRTDVTLHLMKSVDGGEATVVAGQDKVIKAAATGDDLTATWDNLPLYEAGKAVTYSVAEDQASVPQGYASEVTGNATDGFTVTNTHTPETTEVKGTKTWDDADNQDGKRPESITVRLLADGGEVDSKTVTAADNWQYSFTGLPKYKAGKVITYTVSEDEVEGYTTKVDGYDLTNSHTPETTSVSGTKTWDDSDNQDGVRPGSITVRLLADGAEVDSKTVTAANDWQYSFTDLPAYQAGKKVTYTVSEDEVEGYTTKVDGYNLTNSHTPATPKTPENPATPETPEVPKKPDTPVTPNTPETPETPTTPKAPETPDTPEISDTTSESKPADVTQQAAPASQQPSSPKSDAQKATLPQTGDITSPVLPILAAALIDLAVFLSLRSRRE